MELAVFGGGSHRAEGLHRLVVTLPSEAGKLVAEDLLIEFHIVSDDEIGGIEVSEDRVGHIFDIGSVGHVAIVDAVDLGR